MKMSTIALVLLPFALWVTPPRTAGPAQTPAGVPSLADLSVLPETSDPEVDALLEKLEQAYASMDVDRWVTLFTDDFEQVDPPRRVHVVGRDAWREQTADINRVHLQMSRVHHGRARIGNWVVAEVEWTGTIRGEAVGSPGEDRRYRYSGLALIEIEDGLVRRQIIYDDVVSLEEQLRN